MVQYLHFRILEFPLINGGSSQGIDMHRLSLQWFRLPGHFGLGAGDVMGRFKLSSSLADPCGMKHGGFSGGNTKKTSILDGDFSWKPSSNKGVPIYILGAPLFLHMFLGLFQEWGIDEEIEKHRFNQATFAGYPPVNVYIAMENCHRNSGFTQLENAGFS